MEYWYVKLSRVEEFVDFEAMDASLRDIDEGALTDRERLAVQTFKLAVERRRAGKSDFDGEPRTQLDSKSPSCAPPRELGARGEATPLARPGKSAL